MALIICPKCGKKFSKLANACPQCGTSIEEALRLIKEKSEQKASERERLRKEADEQERLRKEREEKEAEEARIRAEKRAEWWKKNKKIVLITLAIIALVLGIGIVWKVIVN